MHTVNYSTTALLFYDRLLWAGVFKINYMLVSELIAKLQALPQEKNVVLCDLQNDGDGDGLANLYEIVSVEEETALQKGKKTDVVFICYNE
jgi:hypothetical protein